MANGEHCRMCGQQETAHKFPHYAPGEFVCDNFESEIAHSPNCELFAQDSDNPSNPNLPLQCNGDCTAFARALAAHRNRFSERDFGQRMWITQSGNLVDIGS